MTTLYEQLTSMFVREISGMVDLIKYEIGRITYHEVPELLLIDIMRKHGFGVQQIIK